MKTISSVSNLPRPLSSYCNSCGTEISTEFQKADAPCLVCEYAPAHGRAKDEYKEAWKLGVIVCDAQGLTAEIIEIISDDVVLLGEFKPPRGIESCACSISECYARGWLAMQVMKHTETSEKEQGS